MILDFNTYKDKVMGCWAGKNIGGVLGAPFECTRQFHEVDFYTQDLSGGPPPNDDLDLQILWLNAVERHGRQINASILGEYWLSFVLPNWSEYGVSKANMFTGLTPPLSGSYNNQYRNSCGCFIRSEIWACLAPGHPEIAARYAYEDGIVDHAEDGVFGVVFCAALESAAFVESDTRKLIDIGLSYIPDDCAVARCVKRAIECYDSSLALKDARVAIHNEAPGTFGLIGRTVIEKDPDGMEVGEPGFDCPENIGYLIAGWLYGEGDFGESLRATVACGEDTDCSAATLGAILGIVKGASALPEKWTKPLDDKIATLCINLTARCLWIPKTVAELTDRVLRVTPRFLDVSKVDILNDGGYSITCNEGDRLYCPISNCPPGHSADEVPREISVRDLINMSTCSVRHNFLTHNITLEYGDNIYFDSSKTKKFNVIVANTNMMEQQMWCTLKLYAPDGVKLLSGTGFCLQLTNFFGDKAKAVIEVDASEFSGARIEIIIDVAFEGRHTNTPVKVILLRKGFEND
jgi:ADP-ribosylglycohydrolase